MNTLYVIFWLDTWSS